MSIDKKADKPTLIIAVLICLVAIEESFERRRPFSKGISLRQHSSAVDKILSYVWPQLSIRLLRYVLRKSAVRCDLQYAIYVFELG